MNRAKPGTPALRPETLEARTQTIGRELLRSVRDAQHVVLNRWTQHVLTWCLADPDLKVRVLRFIDCLPSLRTPQAVVRRVRDYFPAEHLRLPMALRLGASLSRSGLLAAPAVSLLVHQIVEHVAKQFIAAPRVEDAGEVVERFAREQIQVSFDVLGEQVVSEEEADRYAQRYLTLIDGLRQTEVPEVPHGIPGSRVSRHLSIKPSALTAHFDPICPDDALERVLVRLRPIATRAIEHGVAITLDMEQIEFRDLTVELAKRLLTEPGIGERLQLGIVLQAYLCDTDVLLGHVLTWLRSADRRMAIRLVKGAYWDYEVANSRQRGWPSPVYLEKWQSDEAFERLTRTLLQHASLVHTEIASHNLRSIAHAMAVAQALGVADDQVEFQVLYGMGEAIQAAVRARGYPVRVYAPLGALIPGMAYLVRRILENTANESFLRQEAWSEMSAKELLAPPARSVQAAHPRGDNGRHTNGARHASSGSVRRRVPAQVGRRTGPTRRGRGTRRGHTG